MGDRKIRIILAKLGDGFDSAMLKLAMAIREAGFEVIYTELQTPEAIVKSAIQESADHIGITTLPGANIEDFAKISELLAEEESSNIKITAGGFLKDEDISRVKVMGVKKFFPKGTTFLELIQWAKEHIKAA